MVVDSNGGPFIAVRRDIDPGDVPTEVNVLGCGQLGREASKKKEVQLAHDGW